MFAVYNYLRSLTLGRFVEDRGATAVEYGLMVALIAITIITAVGLVGTRLETLFNDVAAALT